MKGGDGYKSKGFQLNQNSNLYKEVSQWEKNGFLY